MYLPWCLERLAKTSTTKNAKSLAILQGLAVYYTALGVKRDTDMTAVRLLYLLLHYIKWPDINYIAKITHLYLHSHYI